MADTECIDGLSDRGLSTAEVERRISEGKVNVNTDLKTKSIRQLVIENTCTLFNLINLMLAMLVILTGAWKNLTFLGVVLLNTAIGIVQAVRSKRMVDKLTLLASKRAVALRDGTRVDLDLDEIVLDDLILLGRGDQVPADAVVVAGEAHLNESLLTGESNPIHKRPGDQLMSGSFIDSGHVRARVVHVGADNYVARINNEAKYVKKVNSEIMGALNAIVRFASVLMVPLGVALFASSLSGAYAASHPVGTSLAQWAFTPAARESVFAAVLSTVGALLGMIPQGLVLLTSSVLAIATIRLARRKVLAQQLYCIETLARVDVLCLDKTGTITSGRMQVAGVHAVSDGAVLAEPPASGSELHRALAGIANATAEDANETCAAILAYYDAHPVETPPVTRAVAFDSSKKWSGATLGDASYVMGAAQFVLPARVHERHAETLKGLADTARVLVVARVDGFTRDGDMVGEPSLLGFVTIRDEIRSSARETIGYFREQGVTLNVISGDDPRTVASIARVVGIPGADAFVDATTLDTPAKIDAAVERYHVFGRVTPQQKRELVVALQKRGHTVAMTGDGVNDVLALKEADCSVAMAAGSDAARNVAEIVLVDNDFASMPAVVAEGRRSINNLQRSAALFLTKTLFSMGLAAICIALPPYPFQPITMTLINFFCIGFPSFVLALEPNRARIKGKFLVNVLKRALPASVGVLATSLLCMALSRVLDLDAPALSSLCLLTTSAVGCALIWRISQPLTPLRIAVLAVSTCGILAGALVFPGLFSVAPPTAGLLLAACSASLVGLLVFSRLADVMERSPERTTRLASGFGRGVRVSVGSSRVHRVSSTGSVFSRALAHLRRDRVRRRGRDLLDEPGESVGSSAADGPDPVVPIEPKAPRSKAPRRARVERSAGGITINMPTKRRKVKR